MKKLLMIAFVLLVSGALQAQENPTNGKPKSFIAFHAGPSFPVGDFSSTNFDNLKSGFAKTGYTFNLNYGFRFEKNVGIAASFCYNNYAVDMEEMEPWQYYCIAVGPMFTFDFGNNIAADWRIMGGAAHVNFPTGTYESKSIDDANWNSSVALQTGIDLRIGLTQKIFVYTGVDYMYTAPYYNFGYTDNQPLTDEMRQKITVVNVSAGIGFKF